MTYAEVYFFLMTAMAKDGVYMRPPVYPDDYPDDYPNQPSSDDDPDPGLAPR